MYHALTVKLQGFFTSPQTEARRIFHGRGQCYPGLEHLCVDWYRPILLISAYAPIDDPATLLDAILAADRQQQIQTVLLQNRFENQSPCHCIHGNPVQTSVVQENGLSFEVNPGRRQNAGLFLDMRLLRRWLLENSAGCSVLNLFAYTCSLSVAALAGNADRVCNVDVSKPSIAWGQRNHRLNGQDATRIRTIPHNLFTSWGRVKQFGPYDLVIMDPPSRQKGSFDAERDYRSVLKRLPKLCKPGAKIIAALNSPFLGTEFVLEQCRRALPDYSLLQQIPPAPEFTESNPEKGLKIFLFQLP